MQLLRGVASGGCVWNYNKSAEDASRGVRWLRVELDGALLYRTRPSCASARHARFDFGQTLHLPARAADAPPPAAADAAAAAAAAAAAGTGEGGTTRGQTTSPLHPRGLDPTAAAHLVGGPALPRARCAALLAPTASRSAAQRHGAAAAPAAPPRRSPTAPTRCATPADINSLRRARRPPHRGQALRPPPSPACRRPGAQAAGRVWLAPWQPEQVNELYYYAEAPVSLGLLRVLNYSKTCARGARDFELLVDDMLVYQGELRAAAADGAGAAWQSVLFTDARELLQQEAPRVHHAKGEHDHVLLINSGQVVSRAAPSPTAPPRAQGRAAKGAADAPRPSTAVPTRA